MAAPILLVADDLPLITAVKRVLAREGYEVVLATSAADAVIAWGHSLPGLMVLQPSVESGRGPLLLDELDRHPDVRLLRVLLLGETIPGHPLPVEPLPIEPTHFARTVEETLRAADGAPPWHVMEPEKTLPPNVSLDDGELDAWRATRPAELDEAALPPAGRRSSETGDHLTDTLKEAPSRVWPSPAPSPKTTTATPIDDGDEPRHPTTGRQYALDPLSVDLRLTPVDGQPTGSPTAPGGAPALPGRRHTPLDVSAPPEGEPGPTRPPAVEGAESTLVPSAGEPLPPSGQVNARTPRRTILPVPSGGQRLPLDQRTPGQDPSGLSPWSPSRLSPEEINPTSEPAPSVRKRPTVTGQRPLVTPAPAVSEPVSEPAQRPRLERQTLLPLPGRNVDDELPIVPEPSEVQASNDAEPLLEPFEEPQGGVPAVGEAVPPGLLRASRPAVSAPALDVPPDFQPGELVSSPLTPEEIEALQPTVLPGGGVVSAPSAQSLAERLFGDLPAIEEEVHRRVEAEAIASLESVLREDDVASRLPGAGSMPSSLSVLAEDEAAPVPVTARVEEALARAEAMVAEGREVYHEGLLELEAEAARRQEEVERVSQRAEEAEASLQAEREARAGLEEEVLRLKASVERLEHDAVEQRASSVAALEAARAHGAAQLTQREGELTETALAWQARAQGAEADLGLLRAELDAVSNEVRQREQSLSELTHQRDERVAELIRERQERLAEVGQRQADAIAAMSRRHDEQVAELRYRLSEAQASAEISKAEATAAGEASRQLSVEQAAHGETRRVLAELEARLVELDAQRPVLEQGQAEASAQRQAALVLVEAGRARIAELEADRAELEARLWSQRSELETRLEDERVAHANGATLLRAELEARLEAERGEHEHLRSNERAEHEAERVAHEARVAELEGWLQDERVAHEARVAELEGQLQDERVANEARVAELEGQLQSERVAHEAHVAETKAELGGRLQDERIAHEAHVAETRAEHEARLAEKLAELAAVRASLEEARSVAVALEARLDEARGAHEALEARLTEELAQAAARQARLLTEVAELKDEVERQRVRAEGAEASASLSAGKVLELEHRNVKALALPGRSLEVSRHGTANLEALAKLVCQLVLSEADAHLELGVVGGTRSLWLRKGHIVAAASSFEREGLIDRARRDGLIDARQEAELRPLRGAALREQLEGLKARGCIRDVEAVPLVQRCAEQVALAALSEDETQYRLQDDTPGWEVTQVTIPRATLPLLAEALRRAVPVDTLLERLGGGDAVPVATDVELDLRALGFSDRERRLLAKVDGAATVEELCLASGLKSDAAFRALEVAQLLGALEVRPPERPSVRVDPELDVHRLEAKYDEVVDADYFTILGLPRTAGADEVQSAWQRLSTEFHPLRFSGHPDAGLQQRAQVVFKLLEEAARALEDDRRRADYARHLLD